MTPKHREGLPTDLHSPESSVILGLLTDSERLPVGSSSMAFFRHRDANSREAIGMAPESALKHIVSWYQTHHGQALRGTAHWCETHNDRHVNTHIGTKRSVDRYLEALHIGTKHTMTGT